MTKNEKQKRHYDWLNQVKEEIIDLNCQLLIHIIIYGMVMIN